MKNLKKNLSKVIVDLANKETKVNLNSTGSTWAFQPKIPQIKTKSDK